MNLITAVSRASLVAALFTSALATAGTTVPEGPIQTPTTSLSVGIDGSSSPTLGEGNGINVPQSPPPIVLNGDGSVTLPTGKTVPASQVITTNNEFGGVTLRLDDGSIAVYDAQGNLKEVRLG